MNKLFWGFFFLVIGFVLGIIVILNLKSFYIRLSQYKFKGFDFYFCQKCNVNSFSRDIIIYCSIIHTYIINLSVMLYVHIVSKYGRLRQLGT